MMFSRVPLSTRPFVTLRLGTDSNVLPMQFAVLDESGPLFVAQTARTRDLLLTETDP